MTPEEIKFIAEYSWEIMNAKFDYYFFNDNCAHRIAKLIELATGRNMSKTSGFWLLPTQVVRKLGNKDATNSFVKNETYKPSLKTVFSNQFNSLKNNEKEEFIEFFERSDDDKKNIVNESDSKNLFLIQDYLDLQVAKLSLKEKDEKKLNYLQDQRAVILSELMHRPVDSVKKNELLEKQSDSLIYTKPPSVFRLGYGSRNGEGFIKMGLRIANNDFLNKPNPGQEVSKFIMGEIEAEATENSLDLSKIIFVDVLNINTNPLPMKMTKEYSWEFKVDYSPNNNICAGCSTFGLEGKAGKASRVNDKMMLYGLAGVRVHTLDHQSDDFFTLLSEAGAVINISTNSIVGLSTNYDFGTISNERDYLLKGEWAYNGNKNFDYRIGIEDDGKDTVVLASIGYYFD